MPKLEAIRQFAKLYHVTQRTVYRWQLAGVNLADAAQVAVYLASQKTASPAALEAVRNLLSEELLTL